MIGMAILGISILVHDFADQNIHRRKSFRLKSSKSRETCFIFLLSRPISRPLSNVDAICDLERGQNSSIQIHMYYVQWRFKGSQATECRTALVRRSSGPSPPCNTPACGVRGLDAI